MRLTLRLTEVFFLAVRDNFETRAFFFRVELTEDPFFRRRAAFCRLVPKKEICFAEYSFRRGFRLDPFTRRLTLCTEAMWYYSSGFRSVEIVAYLVIECGRWTDTRSWALALPLPTLVSLVSVIELVAIAVTAHAESAVSA